VFGWWILSYDWSINIGFNFRPWRLLFFIYGLPGVLALIWLLNFPESPKSLMSMVIQKSCQTLTLIIEYFLQNKDDEALKIVRRIFYENKGTDSTAKFSVRKLVSEVSVENRLNRNKGL
jgi:hypothetical protein